MELFTEEVIRNVIIFFSVGILTYIVTNIDDMKNISKDKVGAVQSILTTILLLVMVCGICILCSMTLIVYIISSFCVGFFGASIMKKIDTRKEEFGDVIVDTIKDKISSFDISKTINSKKVQSTNVLEFKEHIKEDIVIDSENTYIDEEQSDYNPFENEKIEQ